MNLLKKTLNVIVFGAIILSFFQCASPKVVKTSQTILELKLKNPIVFQEWYAGIKVGGTGINVFVPHFDTKNNIQMDSIYFRNMKGKLVSSNDFSSAVLKNDSKNYTPNPSNTVTNPFNLGANECIVSYLENGETKYMKIASIVEKAGTYYENGPPLIYDSSPNSIIATVEEDN